MDDLPALAAACGLADRLVAGAEVLAERGGELEPVRQVSSALQDKSERLAGVGLTHVAAGRSCAEEQGPGLAPDHPLAGCRDTTTASPGGRIGQGGRYDVGHGDAVAFLRSLPDDSVDLVITDPPYESLEKHRAIGTTTRLKHSKASSNDWFEIFPNERFEELFAEIYRVLKPNRHFYLFCGAETMFVAKPLGEDAGFKFWKPLVWDKVAIGMGYHYRARYELIPFFEKGKRKLNDLGVPDILAAKRVHRGYPTEKPAQLAEILVSQSTSPGELVLDPFMGNGSTGFAAVRQQRSLLRNDLCAEAVDITRRRLLELGASETEDLTTWAAASRTARRRLPLGG